MAAEDSAPSTLPSADGALSLAGAGLATAAYVAWGFAPIYWKQLTSIDSVEVLACRIVLSALLAIALVIVLGQLGGVRASLMAGRARLLLAGSAVLIGFNWWVFIYAVTTDRIVDTSLGYYLTPLLNVALGLVVFRERLRVLQWLAVCLAALGVSVMAFDLGRLPWISLALGGSFALYGAIRKTCEISSLGGLLVETAILSIPAAAWLAWLWGGAGLGHGSGGAQAAGPATWSTAATLWLLAAGLVTAFPLVCFASAARRLPLSAVGLFQYIAPSMSLAIAVTLYDEPFTRVHAVTFALIWLALGLYVYDGVSGARAARSR